MITCGGRRQSLIIFAVFTLLLVAIFYKVSLLPLCSQLVRDDLANGGFLLAR